MLQSVTLRLINVFLTTCQQDENDRGNVLEKVIKTFLKRHLIDYTIEVVLKEKYCEGLVKGYNHFTPVHLVNRDLSKNLLSTSISRFILLYFVNIK